MSKLTKPVFPQQEHFCKTCSKGEPDALKELKHQLANINCKCRLCAMRYRKRQDRITIKYSKSATHVEDDRFIHVAPKTALIESKTQTSQNTTTHLSKLLCMNEHTGETDSQADQSDYSVDRFIQASPKPALIDSNKLTLQISNFKEPLYTNACTSGKNIQADKTDCIVDKIIQACPKTVSIEPDTQIIQIALTHLKTPVYKSDTDFQTDQTDCSVDKFTQAGPRTVSVEPDTQTFQIALTHLRTPLRTDGYTSGTDVQADQIECLVDRCSQVSAKTASIDSKTQTLQSALTQLCKHNVLCPTCTIAFSFLRGDLSKVYKDEESATAREMSISHKSTCHRSTSYDAACVDRSTSMTSRLLLESSRLSFSDLTSNLSSGTSINHRPSRVRFRDEVEKQHRTRILYNPTYLSVESFIDSIRPPL